MKIMTVVLLTLGCVAWISTGVKTGDWLNPWLYGSGGWLIAMGRYWNPEAKP